MKTAFRKTGIYPPDRSVYTGDDFAPSKASSCQVHLPESFVGEAPSSDDMAVFTSDASYILPEDTDSDGDDIMSWDHETSARTRPRMSSLPPSSDLDPYKSDSESEDSDSECGSDAATEPDPLHSDHEIPTDANLGANCEDASNTPPNTRSSPDSHFRSQRYHPPPVVRTLEQDMMLSDDAKFDELRNSRRNVQLYYDMMLHYKGLWEASEAHNHFMKTELALAKEQIANLEAKKSRRGTAKIKARIMVHTEHKEAYARKQADREQKEMEAREAEAKAEAEKVEREQRMKEEEKSRELLTALSSYKLRDDLVVIARILKIDDTGTVKELRKRIGDYVNENEETVSGIPRLSGLVKSRRGGDQRNRKENTTTQDSQEAPAMTSDGTPPLLINKPNETFIPPLVHANPPQFDPSYHFYTPGHHYYSNPYHGHYHHSHAFTSVPGPSTLPSLSGPSHFPS